MVLVSGTKDRHFGWIKLPTIRGVSAHMDAGGNTGAPIQFLRPSGGALSKRMRIAIEQPVFSFHFKRNASSSYLMPTSSFVGVSGGALFRE